MTSTFSSGVDVSHYQGTIDWAQVAADGIGFAMIKATQGTGYIDPCFSGNWASAKQNGLQCGAYHYFLPTSSFLKQADLFLSQLDAVGYDPDSDLPPAIDCEETNNCSMATYSFALTNLLQILQRHVNVRPMIYTSPDFWSQIGSPDFSSYPLWLADYTSGSAPNIPPPWTSFAIWQYSDDGSLNGISGNVDLDRRQPGIAHLQSSRPALDWF